MTTKKISIFGLGYVGLVSGACLARLGHEVVGVDISDEKIGMVNDGISPIIEEGISELVRERVDAGKLRATTDAAHTELIAGNLELPDRRCDRTRLVDKIHAASPSKTEDNSLEICLRSILPLGLRSSFSR